MKVKLFIITPIIEQRVSKMAQSFNKDGYDVEILSESNNLNMFDKLIENISITQTGKSFKKLQAPIDFKRDKTIYKKVNEDIQRYDKVVIIIRDVILGARVGNLLSKFKTSKIYIIIDIADNFDLLYDAFKGIKRYIYKFAMKYFFVRSLKAGNMFLVVCDANKDRIASRYDRYVKSKKINVLRNLPIINDNITSNINNTKLDKTMVYVGYIDEIARDLSLVVEALKDLKDWNLYIYSAGKEASIQNIKYYAENNSIADRVHVLPTVAYENIHREISKYTLGVIPHKRNLLTDFTVPNKLYDYNLAGIPTVMSDNPAMEIENSMFNFGIIYKGENKESFIKEIKEFSFVTINKDASRLSWEENIACILKELQKYF